MQSQTAFYTAESWLQHMLLLAFLAHLEAKMRADREARAGFRLPGRGALDAACARLARIAPGLRAAAGAAALGLAGASIASSAAIHAGATAMWRADHGGPFIAEIERAIGAFEPARRRPPHRAVQQPGAQLEGARRAPAAGGGAAARARRPRGGGRARGRARKLGAAPRAGAALPEGRRHPPDYAARAERHLARSRILAPNLDPMEAPLPPAAARPGTR